MTLGWRRADVTMSKTVREIVPCFTSRVSIAFLVQNLEDGGAERVVLNLAAGLNVEVYDAWVVLWQDLIQQNVPPGLEIIVLGGKTDQEKGQALINLLRRRQPELVCSHMTESNVRILQAREHLDRHLPVIAVEHTMPSRLVPNFWNADVFNPGDLLTGVRHYYKRADAIVAMCATAAVDVAALAGLLTDQVHVIPNPVLPPELHLQAQQIVEHDWVRSHSAEIVLCIGRLKPEKNFELMLNALPEILHHRPTARMLIVGRGELESSLRRTAITLGVADRVSFVGHVENPYPYLARANVLAIPSVVEGLPNVLIEALALHTPAVATRLAGGSWELIEETGLGRIVECLEPDYFAQAVVELLQQPPRDGFEKVVAPFTTEIATAQYESLIWDVLKRTAIKACPAD